MVPGSQLLAISPGADKKRSCTMGQGTVIDKSALGLDRAWFMCQVHCGPGIDLKGRGGGMCLLSKREST